MSEELIVKLKIDVTDSMHKIIEYQANTIRTASNPLEKANIVLTKFGVEPINDPDIARLTALSLIEQLVLNPKKFNIQKAEKIAVTKVRNIYTMMGRSLPDYSSSKAKVQKTDDNYKVTKAMEIYRKYSDKPVKYCTEKIAKALKIPYTSAYYYYRKISKN